MAYSDQQPAPWAEAKGPAVDLPEPNDGTHAALSWTSLAIVVVILAAAATVVVGGVLYGLF